MSPDGSPAQSREASNRNEALQGSNAEVTLSLTVTMPVTEDRGTAGTLISLLPKKERLRMAALALGV
jgi:hypothetical protein